MAMIRFVSTAGLLAAALLVPAAALAQALKPITFEDIAATREPTVALLDWTGDSRSIVVTRKAPGATTAEVLRIDAASGKATVLGTFAGSHFSLSPDGRQLVHFDGADWKVVDLASGSARTLFKSKGFQFVMTAPSFSRDGKYVAVGEIVQPEGQPRLDPATIQQSDGVRVIDVGAAADQLAAKLQGTRVQVYDLATLEVVHRFEGFARILDMGWGPAGRFYYSMQDNPDLANWRAEVHELTIATKADRVLYAADALIQPMRTAVSPDGKTFLTAYNLARPDQDTFKNLILTDRETLAAKRLSGEFRVSSSYQWMPDGRSIVVGERRYGFAQLVRLGLDGKAEVLTDELGNHGELRVAPDGSAIAYTIKDAWAGQRVVVRPMKGGAARTVLEVTNYRDKYAMASVESARWTTSDGVKQHGFLFKPPGFDPAKQYPVIVDIHGGGAGANLYLFGPLWTGHLLGPLEWHAWAGLGYVVLVPEMRTSGEMGGAAAAYDAIRDSGGAETDAQDVMHATDWIIAQPWIDPKRVALYGLSAGGGRVNKTLTIDHRYAAAVIQDPVRSGALESLITQSLAPYTGVKIGKQPCLDALARSDPTVCGPGFLFDGVKSTTPTLIFVGNVELGAVAGFSMDVLFTILRKNGVPTRMLRYLAEGHGSNSAASAMHKTQEVRRWFEQYLPANR